MSTLTMKMIFSLQSHKCRLVYCKVLLIDGVLVLGLADGPGSLPVRWNNHFSTWNECFRSGWRTPVLQIPLVTCSERTLGPSIRRVQMRPLTRPSETSAVRSSTTKKRCAPALRATAPYNPDRENFSPDLWWVSTHRASSQNEVVSSAFDRSGHTVMLRYERCC
jgi:hypothetical protein